MCCCKEPNVNGTPNVYSWDGKSYSTRPIDAPTINNDDELLVDEPGRCGGVDSHSHHFRIVKQKYGGLALLVRHGGGDERIQLGHRNYILGAMSSLDSNGRYWLMLGVYHVSKESADNAITKTRTEWADAFVEKRLKLRRRQGRRWVEIKPPAQMAVA